MKKTCGAIIFFILLSSYLSFGAVLLVPSQPYPTIEAAVAIANANADLTNLILIQKSEDPYYIDPSIGADPNFVVDGPGILVTKSVTIKNADKAGNPADVVIDCKDQSRAFTIQGVAGTPITCTIENITFTNCSAAAAQGKTGTPGIIGVQPDEGGAVPDGQVATEAGGDGADAAGDGFGGALQVEYATLTVKNCVFRNCNITGARGGQGGWGTDVDDDDDQEYQGADGGSGGKGDGNGFGGAISLTNSTATIQLCVFEDNMAFGGIGGDGSDGGEAGENGSASSGGNAGNADGYGFGGAL